MASLVWKTEGYSKNAVFTIQKSADGIDFQSAGELAADSALHQYTWKDHQPLQGRNNYYRIKITSQNDSTKFSSAVSVYIDKVTEGFSIFPNPVTGSRFNVNIVDEAKGTYTISLNNSFGLKLVSKSIKYSGGKHTEQFIVNKSLMKGVYRLQITGPGGFQKVISVLY